MFGITPYERCRRGVGRRRDIWDIDKMFDSMMKNFYESMSWPLHDNLEGGIRVDVKEDKNNYKLEAELPGVNKEDIKLELRDDVMTLSVEKSEEIKEEKENYLRQERKYGNFARSFYIDDVNADKIKAKFKDGILYIKLPKKEPGKSQENIIPIE